MPIGTIQQSDNHNAQSAVLTDSSVMVASVVYGEWRWQPYQNLLNSVFIPYMSASVIEWRSVGSCSSTELCAGLLITGLHLQLLFTPCLPLTQNASKGYENNFQEPVLYYRLSMFCKLCHLPEFSYGYRDPTTRTHTGAGDTVWQSILNLYYNTEPI